MAPSNATTSTTTHGYNLRSGSGNTDGYNLRTRKTPLPRSVRALGARITVAKERSSPTQKDVEPVEKLNTPVIKTSKPSLSTLKDTVTPSISSTSSTSPAKSAATGARYTIPPKLTGSAKCINDDEVELMFHLDKLTKRQRLVWGLPHDFTNLLIRLSYGPTPASPPTSSDDAQSPAAGIGFCVHTPPPDVEGATAHQYLRADRPWPDDGTICTSHDNILTYVATRKLFLLFSGRQTNQATIKDVDIAMAALIHDDQPAGRCVTCQTDIRTKLKMYRATTCSEPCRDSFNRAPLAVRVSPFLLQPSVLDFLLCAVNAVPSEYPFYVPGGASNTALRTSQLDGLVAGCPLQMEDIVKTIDSFPQLTGKITLADIIGCEYAHGRKERRELLSWIVNEFRGCMVPLPKGSSVPGMPDGPAFMMLNSDVDDYRGFSENLARQRTGKGAGPTGGWAVFHGTPPSRVFPILRRGLSSSRGIYCSDRVAYSVTYAQKCGTIFTKWKNSLLPVTNFQVVFGCELAAKGKPVFSCMEHSFGDEKMVTLRYIFLLPTEWINRIQTTADAYSYNDPPANKTRPAMEQVYRMLHAGEPVEELSPGAQTGKGR